MTTNPMPSPPAGHPPPGTGGAPLASSTRPAQAVRVSYVTAWLYFFIVVLLVLAWWFPISYLIDRVFWPPATSTGPRDAYSFVALAYSGVSDKTNEVNPQQFQGQLDALRAAGYVPVRLDDVRALYEHGQPLPRKAVLMTFDHGRKTSYFMTKTPLRRAGWNAVMFLWTRSVNERDPASLLWPYIARMVRSRTWEVGAQSHNGFESILVSPSGRRGHFMTSPIWIAQENRFETVEEFQARLTEDHEHCRSMIERRVGRVPQAFAYPYGDFGQFQPRASVPRVVNLALVARHYPLGFITGNLALNTRYSDPRRLNRLAVRSEWSGADLVSYLERSWPIEEPVIESDSAQIASSWIPDWGGLRVEKERLVLFAPEQTTGAKMWLAGSDLSKDFYARIGFRLEGGQMGVYLRAAADEESYIYLVVDSLGDVWLRQKNLGIETEQWEDNPTDTAAVWLRQKFTSAERFTLASSKVPIDPTKEHVIEVYLRGKLLYALLDGGQVFRQRITLRGDPKPGMLGLSVWAPEKGQARVAISSVSLQTQKPSLAAWDADTDITQRRAFQWVHQNAYRLTQLCPPWLLTSAHEGQAVRATWDPNLYRLLARIYHLRFMPQVSVVDEEALHRLAPSRLAEKLAEMQTDGLFVDLDAVREPNPSKIATWLQQCSKALQDHGLGLLVRLPPMMENAGRVRSLLAMMPGLQIVAAPNAPLTRDTAVPRNAVAAFEKPPETSTTEDLPLYFEIGPTSTNLEDTIEVRIDRLQQEGQAAYLEEDYRGAIERWSEWEELDPGNPRVLMLLGDAHVRLREIEQAIRFYDRSLDLDPGQITLALRRAALLDSIGKPEEATDSLNIYARLFPENPTILLAQASWLMRHTRTREGVRLVDKVLERYPDNIEALSLRIRLSANGAERAAAVQALAALGERPEALYEVGQAIWKHSLLAFDGTRPLMQMVRRVVEKSTDPRVYSLYQRLMPRTETVVERFPNGQVSDAWWLDGGEMIGEPGRLRIRTDAFHTETVLRLLGSEHASDAFIEAKVHEVTGAVWLYARRASDHLIRLGTDKPTELYLQVWRNGRLVQARSKPWTMPVDGCTLRLEVRGNGASGLVDGVPTFEAPVPLTHDFGYGWFGVGAYHPDRGRARLNLESLASGALPIRMAWVPFEEDDGRTTDELLAALREQARYLTALIPSGFTVRSDGQWVGEWDEDRNLLGLFARYNRIRLFPLIQVERGAPLDVERLLRAAETTRADGFILAFPEMPPADWFQAMAEHPRLARLEILVAVFRVDGTRAQVRACGTSGMLFNSEAAVSVDIVPWPDEEGESPWASQAIDDPLIIRM